MLYGCRLVARYLSPSLLPPLLLSLQQLHGKTTWLQARGTGILARYPLPPPLFLYMLYGCRLVARYLSPSLLPPLLSLWQFHGKTTWLQATLPLFLYMLYGCRLVARYLSPPSFPLSFFPCSSCMVRQHGCRPEDPAYWQDTPSLPLFFCICYMVAG